MTERRGPVQLLLWLAVVSLGIGGVSAAMTREATDRGPASTPTAPWTTAGSWGDLDGGLARVAPMVGFLAAEVVDGECLTVNEVAADRPRPLASVHKLYVLGALGEAVEAARVRWDQEVDGTKGQVRDLAEAMMRHGDETATQVLFDLVGRQAVEQVQVRMGMAEPERNVPFLSLAERRRSQADRTAGWLASPNDLCRAHVALQRMAARPGLEPIRSILGEKLEWLNPTPDYVGFKGGSEPGVYDLTFYIERGDKQYAVVMLLSNPGHRFRASPAIVRDAYRLLTASKAR